MTMTNYEIIQKLAKKHNAEKEEFIRLLTSADEADFELLGQACKEIDSQNLRQQNFYTRAY